MIVRKTLRTLLEIVKNCKKEIGNELIITIKDASNFIVRRNIRWMN